MKLRLQRSDCEFLHPGISADLWVEGEKMGFFGEVHPTVADRFGLSEKSYIAQLDFDALYRLKNNIFSFETFAKFPPVDRDFALIMDEDVLAQDVLDEIKNQCPLCEYANLFDTYRSQAIGEGKKSLAINVRFRDKNKTLKDVDIEKQVSICLQVLKDKFGAVLRS